MVLFFPFQKISQSLGEELLQCMESSAQGHQAETDACFSPAGAIRAIDRAVSPEGAGLSARLRRPISVCPGQQGRSQEGIDTAGCI